MKRFVTYLYEYTGTNKGKNTGFIKADIKDQICQMKIHLKNVKETVTTGEVVLIVNDAGLVGVKVGEMSINKGQGDFHTIIKMNHIADTPYTFQQIGGVGILYGEEMLSASKWIEDVNMIFSYRNIHIWQPPQLEEEKKNATNHQEEEEKNVNENKERNEMNEMKGEMEEKPEEMQEEMQEEKMQEEGETLSKQELQQEKSTESVRVQNVFPQENWEEQWKKMKENYPSVDFKEMGDNEWIRTDVKALRELPKRNWYLGNNSFLLHGFFNYHYCILGKEVQDGKVRWLLGVPGVFQQQERVMATIFGFPEFYSEQKVEENQAFGYWIHTLDI